jgi:hypothetical protein
LFVLKALRPAGLRRESDSFTRSTVYSASIQRGHSERKFDIVVETYSPRPLSIVP